MGNDVQRAVQKVMKQVRVAHFARSEPKPNPREPVVYWEETCLQGRPYMVPLIILRTRPCRWFTAGGCVMCNYELLAVDEGVSDEDLLVQLEVAMSQLQPLRKYPYLLVTSQGSFLDDAEVSLEMRSRILQALWGAGLQAVSTESEARYCLDANRLAAMRSSFPGRISIGIGLEAADDEIRNCIINKGLTTSTFQRAARTLSEEGVHFYTYVTLGKPFLTVDEDVSDAVATIELSLLNAAFMCVVEMVNIQPHTLTHRLWTEGTYRPPWLWTAFELLSRVDTRTRELVSIKGFDSDTSPVPLDLPRNCAHCNDRIRGALNHWNLNRDFESLWQHWKTCDCWEDWRDIASQTFPTRPIERARTAYDRLTAAR